MAKRSTAVQDGPGLPGIDQIGETRLSMVLIEDLPSDDQLGGAEPDSQLVDSIRALGMLQPPIVVFQPDNLSPDTATVVAGKRRVKAARRAGLTSIPILCVASMATAQRAIVLIAENRARSENPGAEYHALRSLLDAGHNPKAVASISGLAPSELGKLLGLAQLQPAILAALDDGRIRATLALAIAKLPGALQSAIAADLEQGKRVTGATVRGLQSARRSLEATNIADLFGGPSLVNPRASGDASGAPSDPTDADIYDAVVDKLRQIRAMLGDDGRPGIARSAQIRGELDFLLEDLAR